MILIQRQARIEALFDDCLKLLNQKAKDYSPGGNAFENFEKIAQLSGLSKEDVLMVLFSKHLITIQSRKSFSEPIRNRIMDAINYLAILEAMVSESEIQHENKDS